jgi:hypothetical protein
MRFKFAVLGVALVLATALPALAHRVRGVSTKPSGGYVIEGRYSDTWNSLLRLYNRNRHRVNVTCTVVAWTTWLSASGETEYYQASKRIGAGIPRMRLTPGYKFKDYTVVIPHAEKWDPELGVVPWYDQLNEGARVTHCH